MTHSEALKLALDALGKFSIGYHVDAVELNNLIFTLQAALEQPDKPCPYVRSSSEGTHWCALAEQPEQEPYCYVYEYDSAFGLHREFYPGPYNGKQHPDRTVPVYTHPPRREWRSLSEEEVWSQYQELWPLPTAGDMVKFARAIEQALKEKNHG